MFDSDGVKRFSSLATLVAFLFFCSLAYPQSEIRSADLAGLLVTPSGQPVAGAKIRATDPQRGTIRHAQTEADGAFHVPGLTPSVYQLQVEADGFPAKVVEGLELLVGETARIQITLDAPGGGARPTFQVEGTSSRPALDLDRTQQADRVTARRLENLPINRRTYLDFAKLSPGVVESGDLVDDTDFRPSQSPQSGLSIGGTGGRGNSFTIDGAANDYNSGGVRPSLSQAAVQEFQVNRNSFSAEFGGAYGGVINIVSKSGTNDFHGNAFGLLRHRSIQARNYFDSEKSPFTRAQYGIAGGGALVPDRTHWFAAYERLDRHETTFVPILRDQSVFKTLTGSQQSLASYLDTTAYKQVADVMRQTLITSNFPSTLQLFHDNSGNLPFGEQFTQFSGRLDHMISERHHVFLRTNFADADSDITQFGALMALSRGRSSKQFDGTGVANSTWTPNARWLVETRVAFGYNNSDFKPKDPYGPGIDIAGFGLFGRDNFLPSKDIERNYQAQQTVSRFQGAHTIKFGFNIIPIQDAVNQEVLMGGVFGFGPGIPLGTFLNIATQDPGFSTNLGQFLGASGRGDLSSALSDSISSLQAYNLGLPLYYQQGFGIAGWNGWVTRYHFFGTDSWSVTRNLKIDFGLRYEYETKKPIMNHDPNNFAPRFGFAWSPGSSHNTVVRGGYGIYYGVTIAPFNYTADHFGHRRINTTLIPISGLPFPINPQTGQVLSSVDVYQSLLARGILGKRSITPADLAPLGLEVGPDSPLRILFEVDGNFRNSYSHQASFEIEHSFGQFTVSAAWNFNRALKLPRAVDRNLVQVLGANGQSSIGHLDPLVLQHNYYESSANSYYNAMVLQAARRLSRRLVFNAHYTWSKTIDDVTDYAPDYQPDNQFDLRAERALSAYHRKHRVVGNAVYTLPLAFTLSGIFEASSGRPFNLLTGYDTVGDNHATAHRPTGLGRNAGMGPNYCSADIRLSRLFKITERLSADLTAESFNIVNRTNFKTINNTVGNPPLSSLPRPIVGNRGSVTEPLAFTSAYDPRQFQFGLGLRW
jgi:hypothetical protein